MIRVFLIYILLIQTSFAVPKEVHFFFISPESAVFLKELNLNIKFSKNLISEVTTEQIDCVPMGDGCFNPQHGFVEGDAGAGKQEETQALKTINAEEINLIDCDKGNYFDIYCGKARKEQKLSGVEFWIDTSSSMRTVDYSPDPSYCERRSIAQKIRTGCGETVDIHMFDTSKKQVGTLENLCQNYGLNNQKKLMSWIRDSNAKVVYILTDKDEFSIELRDFLHSVSARVYGGDSGTYTMKSMHKFIDNVANKHCK